MHTPDNENTTTRTSAAQINEAPSKDELIKQGLKKDGAEKYPYEDETGLMIMAYTTLDYLCAKLTSTDKNARQWAKDEIRRLVKLGKGE